MQGEVPLWAWFYLGAFALLVCWGAGVTFWQLWKHLRGERPPPIGRD